MLSYTICYINLFYSNNNNNNKNNGTINFRNKIKKVQYNIKKIYYYIFSVYILNKNINLFI